MHKPFSIYSGSLFLSFLPFPRLPDIVDQLLDMCNLLNCQTVDLDERPEVEFQQKISADREKDLCQ